MEYTIISDLEQFITVIEDLSRKLYHNNNEVNSEDYAMFFSSLSDICTKLGTFTSYQKYEEIVNDTLKNIMDAYTEKDEVLFADIIRHDLNYILGVICSELRGVSCF